MADLWDRIQAAKARAAAEAPEAPVPPEARPPLPTGSAARDPEPAPELWRWVSPLVAERTLEFPLDAGFWRALGPGLDPAAWQGVLCFDTETTGLSGGAGTVAFLVGWASLTPDPDGGPVPWVEVRQWFLRDHPGEADLIEALDPHLAGARALVSFNGASFDLPLLRSRWALAGRPFPERPHRDDLHPSRRLWKRVLDTCRLGRLEELILGLNRVDDVPGALVPALWYDYLRQGAGWDFLTPLEGVLRHHAQDVYSLLCLDLVLAALRRDPGAPRWTPAFEALRPRNVIARPTVAGLLHPDLGRSTPVDFWGVLALRPEADRPGVLEAAWADRGDEGLGLAWAEALKRQGDGRAVGVWRRLWDQKSSYPALEELVKWLEHRDRSEGARREALELVNRALGASFLPRAWREGLVKRRDRLETKLRGRPAEPS